MLDTKQWTSRPSALRCGPRLVVAAFLFHFANASISYGADLNACTQAKDSADALRECMALLQSPDIDNQDRIVLHLRRGRAWLAEDEPAEAVKDFTQILAIDGRAEEALILRAQANTSLGQHKLAADDWTAVIDLTQSDAVKENSYMSRAAAWLAAGNFDAALADYDTILKGNPKSVLACLGRANVFVTQNNRQKALEEFARAIAIDAQDVRPHIARAEAAERWGDLKMAIDDYMFVVKNNTRSAGPYRKALQRLGVDTVP